LVIEFRIDRRSGVPPYLQIVTQVRQALLLGRLQVGDKLPTARDVVASTTINPNTVLKAYRELEHDNLVEGRVGAGTFITRALAKAEIDIASPLGVELGQWIARATGLGLERHEIDALIKASMDQVFDPTTGAAQRGDGPGWEPGGVRV